MDLRPPPDGQEALLALQGQLRTSQGLRPRQGPGPGTLAELQETIKAQSQSHTQQRERSPLCVCVCQCACIYTCVNIELSMYIYVSGMSLFLNMDFYLHICVCQECILYRLLYMYVGVLRMYVCVHDDICWCEFTNMCYMCISCLVITYTHSLTYELHGCACVYVPGGACLCVCIHI